MTTTPTPTSGAADLLAMVSKALREAYNLGMMYWQQADSEYISQHKKADDTRAKFLALVEEACAALAAGQATAAKEEAPANMQVTEKMRAAGDCAWMTADRVDSARVFRAMLAAAPGQPAAEPAKPIGYLNPKVLGPDGKIDAPGALTYSSRPCGGWTFPIYAAAPAQPAAQQGVAYAALPDEGEPWRGHKFKEVQRGCWRCDCGKTIKEVTSDQSTPASGGNYPVMPKRYTVDDDGEELFTAEKMRAFADATHTLRASHGEAPAQTADSQLLQFYGVTTDAELIAAQAAHIEKLQAKLTKTPSFAPQRVREG